MTLPDRLSAALSSHSHRIGDSENRPTGREIVQRGDIRQVGPCFHPYDAVRMALVLTVDPDKDSAEMVLVHPYVELATETDLIFAPDETGAPYPVVVQTGIRSATWTFQIQMHKRVGSLSEEDLEEFGRVAIDDDPFIISPRTGLPLAGPVDYRWSFKLQEVETLNHLAADRISDVFEDDLDSRWLPSSSSQDPASSSLADEQVARPYESDMDELEALLEADAFNLDIQVNQLGRDLGRDICNSYQSSFDRVLAHA